MNTPTKENIIEAMENVIAGRASINGEARRLSLHMSSLHNRLQKDPRYHAAKVSGLIRQQLGDTTPLDPEKLRRMPEIEAIIAEKLSYNEAANRFGGTPTKWRNYILKSHPDYAAKRALTRESKGVKTFTPSVTPTEQSPLGELEELKRRVAALELYIAAIGRAAQPMLIAQTD